MSPTIYLTVILAFLISLIVMRLWEGTWEVDDAGKYISPGILTGFIFGCVAWFFIGLVNQPESIQYEKSERQLVALKNGESMSGSFFLGSGSFSGDMKYYGYEDLGNERYKMVKFPNSSIIIEDVKEGEKPYFVEFRKKADAEGCEYKKWMMGPFEMDNFVGWEIHIPKGSILRGNFELDLN
jgi:hypothetical protein